MMINHIAGVVHFDPLFNTTIGRYDNSGAREHLDRSVRAFVHRSFVTTTVPSCMLISAWYSEPHQKKLVKFVFPMSTDFGEKW